MLKKGQNWGKYANYSPQCSTKICTTAGDKNWAESSIKRSGRISFVADNLNRSRNRTCKESWYCDGYIHCPWLTPNDEANCSACPSNRSTRCQCNNKEKFSCETSGKNWNALTCYDGRGTSKLFTDSICLYSNDVKSI